jgi:hypothetical protein
VTQAPAILEFRGFRACPGEVNPGCQVFLGFLACPEFQVFPGIQDFQAFRGIQEIQESQVFPGIQEFQGFRAFGQSHRGLR